MEDNCSRLISPQKYSDIWGIDRRLVVEMCREHYEGFPASRLGSSWKIDRELAEVWMAERLKKGLPLFERAEEK